MLETYSSMNVHNTDLTKKERQEIVSKELDILFDDFDYVFEYMNNNEKNRLKSIFEDYFSDED